MRLIIIALLIFLPLWVQALPRSQSVPGGIAILTLSKAETKPSATFNDKSVMVVKSPKTGNWLAILGIPLKTKPGVHELKYTRDDVEYVKTFRIGKKNYKKQYIRVKNKRHVNPNKKDLERILREKDLILELLARFSSSDTVDLNFKLPLRGRLSSPFGLRRFFNNEERKPHSGIDIAAKRGTAIRSPANGTIINTGDYFFNGNSIFIDHGQGLVSMYCHMHKINVKEGQTIKKGQIIGKVGSSGRATGPHLHWGVFLNGTGVNPHLFLSKAERRKLRRRK